MKGNHLKSIAATTPIVCALADVAWEWVYPALIGFSYLQIQLKFENTLTSQIGSFNWR